MKYSEWKNVKLSDIADITMGQSPKSEFYNNEGIGIEFLQGNRTFARIYPDYDTWCTKPSRIAEEGSVLMSVRAPVGDLNIANKRVCIGRGLCSLKMKNNNNNMFLYYLLEYNKRNMINNQTGTIFGSINKSFIESMQVRIPKSILEQEKIMETLSTIDYKIELNNKINNNLEELAQTLYKHWFIDFEFPNTEGEPYKSSGGNMIDSDLGLIPENWTIQYLNEVLEFERGIEPGSKNYEETYKEHLVPFYRVGDMINQDKVVYVDKELTNNKIANVGDVFVSFDGALGRISNTLNGSYSTGIRKVFSKEKFLSNNFIYVLFQSADIQNTIKMYASGTTILHASSSIQYLSMPFNKDIVDKFTETISPIVDKIITNKIENIKLAEMRDLLLPKLMSGEIRMPVEE